MVGEVFEEEGAKGDAEEGNVGDSEEREVAEQAGSCVEEHCCAHAKGHAAAVGGVVVPALRVSAREAMGREPRCRTLTSHH